MEEWKTSRYLGSDVHTLFVLGPMVDLLGHVPDFIIGHVKKDLCHHPTNS